MFSQWNRAYFFSNFLLLRIMCVRYLVAIWEKNSIGLRILELGICRTWRSSTVVVCRVPLIPTMIIIGGSIIHPSWERSGWRIPVPAWPIGHSSAQ